MLRIGLKLVGLNICFYDVFFNYKMGSKKEYIEMKDYFYYGIDMICPKSVHVTLLLHCITSVMMQYTMNNALYHQPANDKSHHQHCITLPMLHYIVNTVLHHQQRTTPSKLHSTINVISLYQG